MNKLKIITIPKIVDGIFISSYRIFLEFTNKAQ